MGEVEQLVGECLGEGGLLTRGRFRGVLCALEERLQPHTTQNIFWAWSPRQVSAERAARGGGLPTYTCQGRAQKYLIPSIFSELFITVLLAPECVYFKEQPERRWRSVPGSAGVNAEPQVHAGRVMPREMKGIVQ